MWPGVPVTAWATMRPRRSNSALARSPASRTIGLNAERCRALACSLTVVIERSPQHLELDGVEARVTVGPPPGQRSITPSGCTAHRQPGRMTVVVSRSSTMAGPASTVPGAELGPS